MKIGISTLGFRELTNEQLAKELSAAGFKTIQLFLAQSDSRFWKYNDRSDLSALTPDRCRKIADTYRSAGLAIHSLGVYTNLIHPDEAERRANLAYFEAMLVAGDHMGVRTFITEAGHYQHPTEPEPRVPLHFHETVWPQMVATTHQLATLAAKFQAKILIEPFYRGFFASAKRTRLFLEEVHSPFVLALLDAANLIEVNDLDEMFAQLGPWIDCMHAKDRKLHIDRGVPAGKGDLDYKKLVTLAAKHASNAPLILEYVGISDYKDALAHLRGAMQAEGVKED
ncbi:MAG: sugar phosphate isomerase/epimerase [Verrucomicrobia bacterium]|nr:sugar phosphate isomerase/epimerase [Verrucomicrobiota bacterium]